MRAILRFLGSRWFLSFIGAALLAVLLWVFGPLLAFLAGLAVRAVLVLVIALVWFGVNFWLDRRSRKRDAALSAGVTAAAADPSIAASAEEVAAIRGKLATALGLLRKARGTRGYLYEQPWYVIIGPPGAGKTTALLNAGLKFPLAADMGQGDRPGAVAGVGGTRMCDWWFTENAVLIDTAGRYTTQDSDAAVDRAGWEGFLDLLRRTRTRQPLNGVIVAIAVPDIVQATPAERLAHARAIRRRVKELTERLGFRIPVYALLTKADLLAGFTEFFDDLDREKRAQVWGMTFPLAVPEGGALAAFGTEFRALLARLNDRLFDRLQAERNPDRRALIAGFPGQVATLEQPVGDFLAEAFGGSRLDPAPFLRGVYMASGTQEGTPIDRLTGALARTFGVDQRRAASLRPEQGRSYFLGRLLRDVIFGEAMLVSADPATTRRRGLLRAGALAAIGVIVLGAAGALWHARAANRAEVDRTGAALAAYSAMAKGLNLDPVNEADLPRVLPLLNAARALPHGYDDQHGHASSGVGFGLSQNAKLAAGAATIYRHALERVLLPRLVWRLEGQMRANLDKPDFLYEATRVYLMLGNEGPLDRSLVHEWMVLDWQSAYPGPAAAPEREALARHLDALLENPLPAVPLDGALVEDARRTFSRVPLAQRVYSRIRPSAAAQAVAPWRPADALGASGTQVFDRVSGKPLTDGISGFYTKAGFYTVLLPGLAPTTKEVASESWVLGQREEINPASPETRNLEHDVVALYTADYAKQWDAMLADLSLVPLRNLGAAVQELYILSSPQSPLRDLLTSIARELTLSVAPPVVKGAQSALQKVAAQAAPGATSEAARLESVLGKQPGPPPEPPGKVIDDRYKALIDFVGKGPGAPMDTVLKLLNDVQQQLSRIASAPPGSPPVAGSGDDPVQLLRAEAERQPEPVSRWLRQVALSADTLRGGGAKQAAAAAFNGPSGPAQLCQKAVSGRYPFQPNSPNDIPLDDFAHLFAPNGLLDGFFNSQLRPYVDTSGHTWRPQAVNGVAAPISAGSIAAFQRAADIRDLFFASGGTQPTVRFDITPISADPGTKQVTLELGALSIAWAHGPSRATQVTWPGPNGMPDARLVFDPPPSSGPPVLQASGPWAVFRLFHQGTLSRQGAAERYLLSFQLGDRQVSYELRAGSVLNPFAPGVLEAFRCPSVK